MPNEAAAAGNALITSVAKPPTFSGKSFENVIDWIESYTYSTTANLWDDARRAACLPAFLNGTARAFYSLEIAGQNLTWAEIKQKLLTQFLPTGYSSYLRNELRSKRQQPFQAVSSYICEIRALAKKYNNNMTEEEVIATILDGMLPPIAQQLIMLNPANLNDLQRKANLIEESYKLSQGAPPSGAIDGVIASI